MNSKYLNRRISILLLVALVSAMAFVVAGCMDDEGNDADKPLDSVDPNSLNPVNAIDKAQEASDIQEELDRVKQDQMDEAVDFNDLR